MTNQSTQLQRDNEINRLVLEIQEHTDNNAYHQAWATKDFRKACDEERNGNKAASELILKFACSCQFEADNSLRRIELCQEKIAFIHAGHWYE